MKKRFFVALVVAMISANAINAIAESFEETFISLLKSRISEAFSSSDDYSGSFMRKHVAAKVTYSFDKDEFKLNVKGPGIVENFQFDIYLKKIDTSILVYSKKFLNENIESDFNNGDSHYYEEQFKLESLHDESIAVVKEMYSSLPLTDLTDDLLANILATTQGVYGIELKFSFELLFRDNDDSYQNLRNYTSYSLFNSPPEARPLKYVYLRDSFKDEFLIPIIQSK